MILIGIVVARVLLSHDDRRPLQSWVVLPVAVMAVAIVLATMFAPEHRTYSGAIRYLQIFALVPLCAFLSLRDARDEEIAMRAILGLGLFEGAVGVYQYFTKSGAGFGTQATRAVGTFGAYDVIALSKVVAYALIVSIAWAMAGSDRRRKFAIATGAFLVVPLAMSLSRGSWLAVVVAVAVMLLAVDVRRGLILIGIGVVLVTVFVGSQSPNSVARKRVSTLVGAVTSPDNSVENRYVLWEASTHIWEHYPLTGVGPKAFPDYKGRYAALSFSDSSDVSDKSGFRRVQLLTPHSLYFLILAELGAIGLAAFLLLVGSLIGASLRSVGARFAPLHQRRYALFSLGTILVFASTSIYGDIGGPTTVFDSILIGCVMANGARLDLWDRHPARVV